MAIASSQVTIAAVSPERVCTEKLAGQLVTVGGIVSWPVDAVDIRWRVEEGGREGERIGAYR